MHLQFSPIAVIIFSFFCLSIGCHGWPSKNSQNIDSEKIVEVEFSQIKISGGPPAYSLPPGYKPCGSVQKTMTAVIEIDEHGKATSISILDGTEKLNPTIITMLKNMNYGPVVINGRPIKAKFKIAIPYQPE